VSLRVGLSVTRAAEARTRAAAAAFTLATCVAAVASAASAATLLAAPTPASATSSHLDADTLYRDAVSTTKSWYVHYTSSSTGSKTTLAETGDAGPASGTQLIRLGSGKDLNDSATIDVIGDTSFLKGNAGGLEALAGFSATQATDAAGQWIEFSTDNSGFSAIVAGVRSKDLSNELALKGALKLGHSRTIDGHAVDAIEGTQTLGHKSVRVVLYVKADGRHVPVEEDSLNAHGQRTKAEHIVYSSWGEAVRPKAPQASISIGHTNTV
jgi:hypothetical protein